MCPQSSHISHSLCSPLQMLQYLKKEGLGGLKHEETIESVIDQIFTGQDTDGDKIITHEEFSGPKHDEF